MKKFLIKNKKFLLAAMMVAVITISILGPAVTNSVYAQTLTPAMAEHLADPTKPQTEASIAALNSAGSKGTCSFSINFSLLSCVLLATHYFLEFVIITPLSWIVALIALILDFFLTFSLNSANYNSATIPAITTGWTVIRDLMNMVFIFVLLYSAIVTILDIQQNYNVRKVLPRLILAALFINFSLFITRVVIDAGNIVAVEFYNRIVATAPVNVGTINAKGEKVDASGNKLTDQSSGRSLSALLTTKLKLAGTYETAGLTDSQKENLENTTTNSSLVFNSIIRIILMCVAIYVLFQMAFIFIGRVVGFFFLMLFSPIGFMGSILPGIGKYSKQWQDELIKQTLVAPIFLIILYVIIKIIDGFSKNLQLDILKGTTVVDPTNITFYANYVLVIGMLILLMRITKGLAGELGSMASDFGKKAMALAAGATVAIATGGTAAALRLGASGVVAAAAAPSGSTFRDRLTTGYAGAKSAAATRWQERKDKIRTGVVKGLEEGSYDIRRAKVPFTSGPMLGDTLKKYTGIDAGKATSPVERERSRRQEEEQRKKDTSEAKYEKDSKDLLVQIAEAEKAQAAGATGTTALDNAEKEIVRIIGQMSSKDIARLDTKTLSKQSVAKSLKGDDIKAIEDSKDLTKAEKNAILDSRVEAVASAAGVTLARQPDGTFNVTGTGGAVNQTEVDKLVGRMSESEVARLNPDMTVHAPIIQAYNAKQIAAIRGKGHLSAAQQTTLTTAIGPTHRAFTAEEEKSQIALKSAQRARSFRTAVTGGNPANLKTAIDDMHGPEDWKSISGESIVSVAPGSPGPTGPAAVAILNNLTASHLESIQQAGILTSQEKSAIATRIKALKPSTDPVVKYLNGPAGLLWS